jgi:CDP-paratose 2-epimerase
VKFLITGGCGFVGSNLALEVLKKGEELYIFDNLFRAGSSKNLEMLRSRGEFKYYPSDIRNFNDVEVAIKEIEPDVIFHLAGQVAMTTSLINPRLDFEINAMGTHNLLESVRRHSPNSIIIYSSTNKVYGDLEYLEYEEIETRYNCKEHPNGFNEEIKLKFASPYGCSKGAADQYLLDYHKMFGIRTVVFRHSSMYGGNQNPTSDQGWISWFIKMGVEIKKGNLLKPFTISGNGKQVRDVLYSDDIVDLYFSSVKSIDCLQGQAFNIGGGMANSLSLLELFSHIEDKLRIKMRYTVLPPRNSDQKVFVADNRSIISKSSWQPKVSYSKGIDKILETEILEY